MMRPKIIGRVRRLRISNIDPAKHEIRIAALDDDTVYFASQSVEEEVKRVLPHRVLSAREARALGEALVEVADEVEDNTERRRFGMM